MAIVSKPPSKEYMENYDKIFPKKKEQQERLEPDGMYIPDPEDQEWHNGE